MIDVSPVPAPRPKRMRRRLTEELKGIPVGGSFVADAATAQCYIAYARYHKLTAVQEKQSDGKVRIWRIA